jgi:cysteine-rich repeat protein
LSLNDVLLDDKNDYTILKLANSVENSATLEPNTIYQVILSATSTNPEAATNQLWSAATIRNPRSWSKPYNQVFTWRFKTKKELCVVSRVAVSPDNYYASSIKEKVVYNAEAYSAPDACSAEGQKIDPWQINWNWSSSDRQVATVTSFSTKGKNQYCTGLCVRKGSDFPFGTNQPPVCGNGKVEAGEDCDSPSKSKGCGLSCLYMGSTASTCGNGVVEPDLGEACDPKNAASSIGCTKDCRHTGSNTFSNVAATSTDASICGNGFIGSGEDCDQAISADSTNPASAFNCSASCKHVGTQISSKWCFDNQFTYGGFGSAEFNQVCQKSISQCGDKVSDPDEDPGCDDPVTGWNSKSCNKFCLKNQSNECVANSEGCDEMGHFKGSSLMYSKPSVCGDAQVGIGEDSFCETSLVGNHKNLTDPWSLVSGVGLGMPSGNPPAQSSDIKAITDRQNNNSSVSGQGKFLVTCGYKTDNECQQVYGGTYGVGDNGCCYAQAKLISTYPLNNTTNACPNTYLEAVFDSDINAASLKDNVVIARGANDCKDSEEVTGLVIGVKNSNTVENIVWYKRMYLAVKNIFAGLFGADVSAAPTKWCVASDIGKAEVFSVTENGSTKSTISINLSAPLAFDNDYAVILKNGVKTERGVSVNAGGKNLSWKFSTISTICQLSGVDIKPQQYSFSRAGATTTLFAWSKTNNGVFIQGIPGFYDWEYAWGSANPYVSLQNSTSSENILTAQNKNGEVDVGATVNVTANKYSNQLGFGAAGSSHIVVFLCENPWPPKDLFVAGKGPYTIFPFTDKVGNNDGFDIASDTFNNTSLPGSALTGDGYFNFGTYYCADSGVSGVADDLPYLRGAVQVTSSQLATTSSLKRFFFTNTKNSDAVAIQIFSNPKHLTVKDWYATNKESGGQGFVGETQQIKIDGNDAITDGNNVYVDALNYSSSSQKIYSNIYLFSINTDAQKDTRQVFEQLVRNLNFNINLTNYGYCGLDAQNPYFQKTCKTDFDCSSGEVCSATIDKLLRNYQRLRDLHAVESILDKFLQENNFAPDFKEGSYLKGQTLSVWPSWSDFSNVVGSSLPVDPINQLGIAGTCSASTNKFCVQDSECPPTEKCVIHNSLTGWSTENRRFSFACATTSFAYRYVYSNVTSTPYVVRARLEDPGVKIQNQITFNKDFVNTDRFVLNNPYGICNQDQEISTQNQGVCGDGQVNLNKGEQCDPPGTVRYGECSVDKKDQIKIDVCSGACGWVPSSTPFVDCSYLSKCGNSKVEVGEQCDDGKLNGRYNHCAKNCTWPPTNPPGYCGDGVVQNASEVCDSFVNVTGKKGVCTSGLSWGKTCDNDNECSKKNDTISYLLGTCTTVDQSRTRYGVDKITSCNWDCQTVGPYCGDGVVQSEFGEDCDGTQICAIGGVSGKKSCTKDCKWADSSPVSWWSFDDGEKSFALLGFKVVPVESFFDKLSQSFVKCIDEECPDYVAAGRVKGALSFDGKTSLDSVSSKNVGVPLNHLSVEAWINPRSFVSDYMRVLEKGGYSNLAEDKNAGGGFGLQFNPAHQLGLALWNENYKTPSFEVYTKNPLPLNKWSHIVATFEKNGLVHQLKIYVNGILDNYVSQATTTPLLTNTNRDMVIGKASWGGDKFDGLLDEIKVYDRTLGIGEIQDRSANNWVCSLNTSTAGGNVLLGMCGDAKVGVGEACDRGDQNGIPCNPKYGGACTYCAGDCKNVVDVQSKEYCGNGKVEGSELCDIDQDTKLMYSLASTSGTVSVRDDSHRGYQVLSCSDEVQSTTTYKKGSKTCVSSCMSLSSSCIACGAISSEDKSAVVVGGSVVNVTDPSSSNPLLGEIKRMNNGGATGSGDKPTWVYFNGSIELYIAQKKIGQNIWPGTSSSTFVLKTVEQDALGNSPVATMNSNSICSFGDGSNYKMRINDDAFHEFSFPVYNKPASWQNDLILSPVISQINRPFDVRIVTTWVNASPNFYSGFIIPSFGSSVTIERLPTSTGLQYYTSSANEGIWYHGFTYTSTKTNVRSFTVDTSKMNQSLYMFYVRVPQVSITDPGIGRYRDAAQLKVDVYLPESDTNSRHFALPSKTFYLKSALQSDNPSASYWYVFNIARNDRGQSSLDQVIPVDKIVTNLKLF